MIVALVGLVGCGRVGFELAADAPDSGIALDVAPPIAGAVYAAAEDRLFVVDLASGVASLVGAFSCLGGGVAGDLALSLTGELLLLADGRLHVVDPATASCAERAPITGASGPIVGIAFGAAPGELYGGTGARPGKLYLLHPFTGVGSELGSYGGGYYSRGDVAWTGGELLGTVTQDGGGDWLAQLDTATGRATIRGTTSTFVGLVADGAELYAFAPDGTIARVDPLTGGVLASKAGGHAWTGVARVPP